MELRLDSNFRENLRHRDPRGAAITHLLDHWASEIKPDLSDISTLGKEVSTVGSNLEDYIVIHDDGVVLVGKDSICNYGPFNGFSSGSLTETQLNQGLDALNNSHIIQLSPQRDRGKIERIIATVLPITSINVVSRKVCSGNYSFPIANVELDTNSKTFVVKTLVSKNDKLYQDYQLIENVVPKEIIFEDKSEDTEVTDVTEELDNITINNSLDKSEEE